MVILDETNDWMIGPLIFNVERGILKQISETYSAKVEASIKDRRIRITSDYEASLDILKLIIYTVEGIKSAVVELSPEPSPDVRSSDRQETYENILRHVMESTNTIIKPKTSHKCGHGVSAM